MKAALLKTADVPPTRLAVPLPMFGVNVPVTGFASGGTELKVHWVTMPWPRAGGVRAEAARVAAGPARCGGATSSHLRTGHVGRITGASSRRANSEPAHPLACARE